MLDAGAAELKTRAAQLDESAPVIDAERLLEYLLEAADAIRTVSDDGSTAAGAVIFEDGAVACRPR